MPNHRNDLENAVAGFKSNLLITIAAIRLFDFPTALPFLADFIFEFDGKQVSFADLYSNPEQLEYALKSFFYSSLRTTVSESFEVTKNYCEQTDQLDILREQEWHQFVRLIRNAMNHNWQFQFDKHAYKHLPITWNGHTITAAMEGKEIPSDIMSFDSLWIYIGELEAFIHKDLI